MADRLRVSLRDILYRTRGRDWDYGFLLQRANGGTKHTMQTIPVWDGLWGSGNNTMPAIFLENGSLANALRPGGKVKEGVLTPAYEQHFRARDRQDNDALQWRTRPIYQRLHHGCQRHL